MSKVFFSPGDNEVGIGTTNPQQNFTISLSAFGVTTGLNTVSGQAQAGTWTNHPYVIMVNSTEVARFATTGLSVTGIVSSTGQSVFPGFVANKTTASSGKIWIQDAGANTYNEIQSRNYANTADLSLNITSSIGVNINGPLSITVGGNLVAQFTSVGLTNTASPLLSLSSFKSVVAASTDFADFKTRVAAL